MILKNVRISVKGRPTEVPCLLVGDFHIIIKGRFLRYASVFDDFLDSRGVDDPDPIIHSLKKSKNADIFSFLISFDKSVDVEKISKSEFFYSIKYDYLAAIRITSFEHWWKNEINKNVRRKVKKAMEEGVFVREVPLEDKLIYGIVRIFNETSVRQGKPFWHYGKNFNQVKEEISTYIDRSIFLGAFLGDQLIGFAKLINCGSFGRANQLLSMVKYRDKSVTNALIAELVKICERENIPYLVSGNWTDNSLGNFRRSNGFKKIAIPRHYVPLTLRGEVALRLGLHKGVREILPYTVRRYLRLIRMYFYDRKIVR